MLLLLLAGTLSFDAQEDSNMATRARIDGGRNTTPPPAPSGRTGGRSTGSGTQGYTTPSTGIMPPVVRDTFTVTPPPPPIPTYGDGNNYSDGGGYSDPGAGMGQAMVPQAPPQTDEQWLATSAPEYQLQLAALLRASQDYEADATAQTTRYGVDYNDALKSLGYTQDNAATANVNEGAWNYGDLNTSAGRSFNNQQNDFAGRGMLQSSLYGTANDNLTRSLNDQLSGVNSAKKTFTDDLARGKAAFKEENRQGQQQARFEALARRAASIV